MPVYIDILTHFKLNGELYSKNRWTPTGLHASPRMSIK